MLYLFRQTYGRNLHQMLPCSALLSAYHISAYKWHTDSYFCGYLWFSRWIVECFKLNLILHIYDPSSLNSKMLIVVNCNIAVIQMRFRAFNSSLIHCYIPIIHFATILSHTMLTVVPKFAHQKTETNHQKLCKHFFNVFHSKSQR